MEIISLLNKLVEGQDLNLQESEELINQMALGQLQPTQMASFLTALRLKGESVDEITGFIKGMRKHMIKLPTTQHSKVIASRSEAISKNNGIAASQAPRNDVITNEVILDIVGTGGDGVNSFNISTTSALVVAGAGVKVAKHGNRAASSKCGSADVLEALGVNINLTPQTSLTILNKVGLVFLFAPLYHPAMKIIGPIRKELGFRTVFNFLGPFLNPAGVKHQLIGVPNLKIAKKLAQVAKKLEYKHLLLVVSEDGMDEISLSSSTKAFQITPTSAIAESYVIKPEKYGIRRAGLKEIQGGDATQNAQIIKNILDGKPGPKRDIVLLNSAFALKVAGKVKTVKEGISLAEQSIDSGAAKKVLDKLIAESNKFKGG